MSLRTTILHDGDHGNKKKDENDKSKKLRHDEKKELEQEKIILDEIKSLENKTSELEKDNIELGKKLAAKSQKAKELKQEILSKKSESMKKNILHTTRPEIVNANKRFSDKNNQILVLIVLTNLIILAVTGLITVDDLFEEPNELAIPTSKYVIENLRGDKVETFKFWKILPDEPLHISVVNSANLSKERLEIVKSVILSNESIEIDDSFLHKGLKGTFSTYYLGWSGALATIFDETSYDIPRKFEFTDSGKGAGDIIITLSNVRDSNGYTGYTYSITNGDQILKSQITIYQADELSENGLETIVRHEFGHALGLAHSSAPEDLMYPEIITAYPYISECNISAISTLYDGKVNDEVICEK